MTVPYISPETGEPLDERLTAPDGTRFPTLDGVPVLVPRPERFLARHAPAWTPADGVHAREWLPIDAPDPLTPFLAPSELADRADLVGLSDWLRALGDRSPTATCAAWGELAPDGPALDLGCGVGVLARRMAEQRETVALDRSPAAVLLARELLLGRRKQVRVPLGRWGETEEPWPFPAVPADRIAFAIADAAALPFAPGTFAWVHVGNLLDVAEELADAILAGVVERLVPNGLVTLSTPHDLEPDPAGPSPEDLLRARLDAAGLGIVDEDRAVPWVIREYDRGWRVLACDCVAARLPASKRKRR